MSKQTTLVGWLVGASLFAGGVMACAGAVEFEDEPEDDAGTSSSGGSSSSSGSSGSSSSSGNSSGSSSSSSGSNTTSSSGGGTTSSSGGGGGGSSSGNAPVENAPAPGSDCDSPGTSYTRTCGLCGKQTALCEPSDRKVTEYGACQNEVANGCIPGTTEADAACGYCGTQSRTCSNTCQWTTSACVNQQTAQAKCLLGETKQTNEGCASPSTFRTWTCDPGTGVSDPNRCLWTTTPPATCAGPTFPTILVPSSANGVANAAVAVADFTQGTVNTSTVSCPSNSTGSRWAITHAVKNETANSVTVRIGAITSVDTVSTLYRTAPPIAQIPTTLAECSLTNDTCPSTQSFTGANSCVTGVVIPAGGTVWVSTWFYSSLLANPSALTVRVERTN